MERWLLERAWVLINTILLNALPCYCTSCCKMSPETYFLPSNDYHSENYHTNWFTLNLASKPFRKTLMAVYTVNECNQKRAFHSIKRSKPIFVCLFTFGVTGRNIMKSLACLTHCVRVCVFLRRGGKRMVTRHKPVMLSWFDCSCSIGLEFVVPGRLSDFGDSELYLAMLRRKCCSSVDVRLVVWP